MKASHDTTDYHNAHMDTPFGPDPGRRAVATHPDDLLDAPGVHLKSREREKGWPKFYGILVKHGGRPLEWTDAEVVVRSVNDGGMSKRTVWTGTVREYLAMWMVD